MSSVDVNRDDKSNSGTSTPHNSSSLFGNSASSSSSLSAVLFSSSSVQENDGSPCNPVVVTLDMNDEHDKLDAIISMWKKKTPNEKESFISKCTMTDVQFDEKKTTILTVKNIPVGLLSLVLLRKFAYVNKVVLGNSRDRSSVLRAINQSAVGISQGVRDAVKAKQKKGKKGTNNVKNKKLPESVQLEGTYFRAINTVLDTRCREAYRKTGDSLTRDDLDRRSQHKESWMILFDLYSEINEVELSKIGDTKFSDVYAGYGFTEDVVAKYDNLQLDDFIALVNYINHKYDETRKKRDKSGQHDDFPNFIDGKVWLLYYWSRMCELGDECYLQMASPELSDDVFMVSEDASTKRKDVDDVVVVGKKKIKRNEITEIDKKKLAVAESANKRNEEIIDAIHRNKRDNANKLIDGIIETIEELSNDILDVECRISELESEGETSNECLELRKLERRLLSLKERLKIKQLYKEKLMAELN